MELTKINKRWILGSSIAAVLGITAALTKKYWMPKKSEIAKTDTPITTSNSPTGVEKAIGVSVELAKIAKDFGLTVDKEGIHGLDKLPPDALAKFLLTTRNAGIKISGDKTGFDGEWSNFALGSPMAMITTTEPLKFKHSSFLGISAVKKPTQAGVVKNYIVCPDGVIREDVPKK